MLLPDKKRVLLVDDAVVVRRFLTDAINQDPAFEVVGTAVNGRIALAKFAALRPDIVLLDIEMPEMDGLETVRDLRKLDSGVPIVMFSSLTERGASVTLEALALGATDYVTKPSNFQDPTTLGRAIRELIPKIRALCRLPEGQPGPPDAVEHAPRISLPHSPGMLRPAQVVAIGASTGGPDALAHVLPLLPANLAVPVVLAQHMPPIFTSLLAARLSAKSALPVKECVSGEPLTPGQIVLAPGNFHMVVSMEKGAVVLRTNQEAKENFCRPSVDVLFRSIASVYRARALAVVLTGMGRDGLKGCEMLRQLGSRIYVQDQASSVVWGMPGFVAQSGLADKILPLDQIASEIVRATAKQIPARASS